MIDGIPSSADAQTPTPATASAPEAELAPFAPSSSAMKPRTLFGGDDGWHACDWTDSDDRVRGGASQSYLCCEDETARFCGTLDVETLGGAGFASQRTTSDDLKLDLSDYAGITLCIKKGDKKRYTLNLKDTLLPPDEETGREKSTVTFECDFELPPEDVPGEAHDESVFIPWDAFTPTYRGRPRKDAEPLDLKNIKRMSIMVRSFFGAQQGDFSITFKSISAVCEAPPPITIPVSSSKELDERQLEDGAAASKPPSSALDSFRRDVVQLINGHRTSAYTVIVLSAVLALWLRYSSW